MEQDALAPVDGEFWLINNPDVKFRGRLMVEGGKSHLWVTGPLVSTTTTQIVSSKEEPVTTYVLRTPQPLPENATILGTLDRRGQVQYNEDVTLLECLCVNPGLSLPIPGSDHQEWLPRLIVRGTHADEVDPKFSRLQVRFAHLDEWAGPYVLSQLDGASDTDAEEIRRNLSASLADQGVVRLAREGIVTTSPAGDRNLRSAIWVEITGLKPMSFDELDRAYIAPLRTLLTLSLGKDCPPVEIQVGDDLLPVWFDIQPTPISPLTEDQLHSTMLLQCRDLGIQGIAHWLNRARLLGHLSHKVAAVVAGFGYTIENEVLDLATAAEGLHRRLHPDRQRFDKDLVEQARAAALQGCDDLEPKLQEAVKSALSHIADPSFRDRLHDLIDDCAAILPDVVGLRPKRWSSDIAEFRNRFAHELNKGHLNEKDILSCLACRESLRWLLLARLLIETGIPHEILSDRLGKHPRYTIFLRQAKNWSPRIYAEG
ncbi:HEPN domain-containing protein [Sphaerisporangium sp. NPDC005288]|uniref:ApeA N-terminal domain 1-containing protein n=1 Tax=Sphaerisporangium sp. NPDC005288 TaxID=3155114 RepID=UPI0033B690FA